MNPLRALRDLRVQNLLEGQSAGEGGMAQAWLLQVDRGSTVLWFLHTVTALHQQGCFPPARRGDLAVIDTL